MYYSAEQDCFYPVELRPTYQAKGEWPEDAVEVTDEEWSTYGQGRAPKGMQRGSDQNGYPTWVDRPEKSLNEVAQQAMARINTGYTAALSQILDEYPDAETLSFDKQEREARTWHQWQEVGGTEPATPYLDAMLAERPIDKAELVARIIAKADSFVAAHGAATGKRQRLEDDVKAAREAEDRDTLEALTW